MEVSAVLQVVVDAVGDEVYRAAGVIDAAKVTLSALQNAASIAALFLTTEAVVCEKPNEDGGGGMPAMPDMDF